MTKHDGKKLIIAGGVMFGLGSGCWAQDVDPGPGKSEFLFACASCHGVDGKGKGPFSFQLKVEPPDLTLLAKKNNGVFPISVVYETIDGRQPVIAHGPRDMPIWGLDRYTIPQIQESTRQYSTFDPEARVRARILVLVDYLNRIQEK